MKPTKFAASKLILVCFLIAITVGLVSWDQGREQDRRQSQLNDTVPLNKTDKKIRDLDDVIEELDNIDLKAELERAQVELGKAMKELDGDKIRLEIEKAFREVDFSKIEKELKESMAKIDLDKMELEWKEVLKEVDMDKIRKEIQESMSKVDFDKIRVELNKVRDINMKEIEEQMSKAREEMKDLGPRLEKELEGARGEIEKAKTELKEYKAFVDGLASDGLINKQSDYTIRLSDGELFINGKKASSEVFNKYRSFLEKHKKFRLEKTADDFDLDKD